MSLFRIIWSFWGSVSFLCLLLFFFPFFVLCILIGASKMAAAIIKIAFSTALFLFGVKIKQDGSHKFDFNQQYIYVFNHTSNLDPLLAIAQTPIGTKFLAKAEILSYPIFGYAVKHLYVPVNRSDKNDRERSMRDMKAALDKGDSLIIYPEGTRNNGPELLKDFRRGAFELSLATGVPIAVISCVNSYEILPGNSYFIRPGTVHTFCDGPYCPEKFEVEGMEIFKKEVQMVMQDRMEWYYKSGVLKTAEENY